MFTRSSSLFVSAVALVLGGTAACAAPEASSTSAQAETTSAATYEYSVNVDNGANSTFALRCGAAKVINVGSQRFPLNKTVVDQDARTTDYVLSVAAADKTTFTVSVEAGKIPKTCSLVVLTSDKCNVEAPVADDDQSVVESGDHAWRREGAPRTEFDSFLDGLSVLSLDSNGEGGGCRLRGHGI
jgi:hypothetical protein